MTKKRASQYFICSLNFKSHNFQTESLSTHIASTYRGSPALFFLVLELCSNPHNTQKWIYKNLNFTQLSVLPVVPFYCYSDQLNVTSNFTRCNKLYLDLFKCIQMHYTVLLNCVYQCYFILNVESVYNFYSSNQTCILDTLNVSRCHINCQC